MRDQPLWRSSIRCPNAVSRRSICLPIYTDLLFRIVAAVSQNSLYVTSKLAQITVERESGCLGLTLRGGADYPLIVTHVRLHGPVYKTGRIKPGDRLLRVDNVSEERTTDGWQLLTASAGGVSVSALTTDLPLPLPGPFRSR